MVKKYKKTLFIILLFILLLGVFYLKAPVANAEEIGYIERQALISISQWVLESMADSFTLMGRIMRGALALSATALTDLKGPAGTDGDAIFIAWKIIRNFVNMIFILMLVVIAFGTIFDTQFGAKNTLGRLIIAALLVNFSLLIGKIVIDFSNIIAASFLSSFGGTEGFVDKMMSAIELQKAYPSEKGILEYFSVIYNRLAASQAVLSSTILAILFTAAGIFAMLIGLFIIIIRIPVLWVVLIFSPIAWAAFIFPNTRKLWGTWWRYLIDWSFVLPIYIFFMYLGIFFVFNASFEPGFENFVKDYNVAKSTGILNAFFDQFKTFFTFVIAMVFMLGGGFFAKKLSGDAGRATASFQSFLGNKIRGGLSSYTGAGVAWKQFQETGRVGNINTPYGGAQSQRLRQAQGANRFEPGAYVKQQQKEVSDEIKILESKRLTMSQQDFNKDLATTKGNDPRGLAAKIVLAEQGLTADKRTGKARPIDKEEIAEFFEASGGDRTPLGQRFLKNLEKSGTLNKLTLTAEERLGIINGKDTATENNIEFRKALGKTVINNNPELVFQTLEPTLKTMSTGDERGKYLDEVKWEKIISKVTNNSKEDVVSRLKTIQESSALDAIDKKKIQGDIEKLNPALIAEATGKNVREELAKKLKGSDKEALGKYLGNVVKSHAKELRDVLKKDFDKTEMRALLKDSNRSTRMALQNLGFASGNTKNSTP